MKPSLVYVGQNIPESNAAWTGGRVRSRFVLKGLEKVWPGCVSLFSPRNDIDFAAFAAIFKPQTIVWIEYPLGTASDLLAAVLSLIPWVRVIVDIQDLPIEQFRALHAREPPTLWKALNKVNGRILFRRSSRLWLASPGFRTLLDPKWASKMTDLPNGCSVEDVDLTFDLPNSWGARKKLLYAGGLTFGRDLDALLGAISNSTEWELLVVGSGDRQVVARVSDTPNTRYLGSWPAPYVRSLMKRVHAIIVPYPRGPYFDDILPVKILDSLAACKPTITVRLRNVEALVRQADLECNVIFLDAIPEKQILAALDRVPETKTDVVRTVRFIGEYSRDAILVRRLPATLALSGGWISLQAPLREARRDG